METSLHQQLKLIYADDPDQIEQRVGRFRIDVRKPDELIEIQHASLSSIRAKTKALIRSHRVRIVKPLIVRKQLVKCRDKGSAVVSRRLSPKRGSLINLTDELIYFTRLFPHRNLILEVPLIHVEEWRYPDENRRRGRFPRKNFSVEDQRLVEIEATHVFATAHDLHALLPIGLPAVFNTQQLAERLKIDRGYAQKVAYCLRHTKALSTAGKQGNAILYRRCKRPSSKVA